MGKLAILTALMSVCYGQAVYSPCQVGNDVNPNRVDSFSAGSWDHMFTNDKYLISEWKAGSHDQCAFRVTARMRKDKVRWVDVGFGVHRKNPVNKFERNFKISRTSGSITIRGAGLSGPTSAVPGCYETYSNSESWYFCYSQPDPGVFHVTGGVPALGCWFSVDVLEAGASGNAHGHDMVTVEVSEFYYGSDLYGICGDGTSAGLHCVSPATCII